MWFQVDSSSVWGIAHRLLRRELASPCRPSERVHRPTFPQPGSADPTQPIAPSLLVSMLDSVKLIVLPAAIIAWITWHSGRVTLASKLRKGGKDWERIQQLLRWEGVESARVYGRADAEGYSADIAAALLVDAHGVLPSSLPPLEPTDALTMIDAAITAADGEAAAVKAGKCEVAEAVRGGSAAASGKSKKVGVAGPSASPATPAPAPLSSVALASGDSVEASPKESWGVVGTCVSIPESAWGVEGSAARAERYEVMAFAPNASPPSYVVKVVRGPLAGSSYLASPAVVRSVLPKSVRGKLGSALRGQPSVI